MSRRFALALIALPFAAAPALSQAAPRADVAASTADAAPRPDLLTKRRALALEALGTAVPETATEADRARALVRRALAGAVALGVDSELGRRLREAGREAVRVVDEQPRAAALLVDLVAGDVARDLAFEPIMEAPLPVGFPAPALAGEILVQTYPGYRLARSEMRGGTNGAFFTLFRHIKSENIAMTAPVEMTVEGDRMVDMGFLYRRPDMGEVGEDGRVLVEDVAPMTVLTIGVRGTTRSTRVDGALDQLEAWLERNAETWERAGRARVMGYNGPMVPAAKQFIEVQIPVRRVPDEGAGSEAADS